MSVILVDNKLLLILFLDRIQWHNAWYFLLHFSRDNNLSLILSPAELWYTLPLQTV